MSCCSAMMEGIKNITAFKVIMFVNVLIALFGVVLFGVGISSLVQFGEDSFFSRELYAMMIVFGLFAMILVVLACIGGKNPKEYPNYLFCYWCIVTALLIGSGIVLYTFNTFVDSLDNAGGAQNNDGGVGAVIDVQLAKEANDFILSVYTSCCTGCVVESDCEEIIQPGDNTDGIAFCNAPGAADCDLARFCNATDFGEQIDGLGLGCYILLQPGEIPGFGVGSDTCAVFQEFGLVGPASDGECGRGNPQSFLIDSVDFFEDTYLRFAIPMGFFIALLTIAWFGSVAMILLHSGGRTSLK